MIYTKENNILITTSGLGSRLGELSQYTNKSILKVGDRAIISRIIDLYPKKSHFFITLGHNGEIVKNYLEIAHPKEKFTYIKIDNYKGAGSSLLYTLTKAKKYLQKPFFFHASDTLIYDFKIETKCHYNWMALNPSNKSSDYRTVNTKNSLITKINEKGELDFDYVYIGLAFIYDHKDFWNNASHLLKKKIGSSDCDIFRMMLPNKIKYKIIDNWFDTGNVDSFKIANKVFRSKYNILDKNDENIYFENNSVIKYFYNEKISLNRYKKSLLNKKVFPKITSQIKHFYSYKFINGQLFSEKVNPIVFNYFLKWCQKNLWIKKNDKNFEKKKIEFYKVKTLKRVNLFHKRFNIKDNENLINGYKVPKLKNLINSIDFRNIGSDKAYFFHGDLILDNIIILKNNEFKLIDWRQDFSGEIESGDLLYDLAKLNHSIYLNHSVISDGSYSININNDEIFCDIYVKKSLLDCRTVLKNFISDNNISIHHVKIITSLIWINMSALHNYPLSIFLYYFGKLNLFLSIKESNQLN